MYRIIVDGEVIQDNESTVVNPILEETVGCAGAFTFSVAYDNPAYNIFKERISVVEIYDGTSLFWKGRLLSSKVGFLGTKTLTWEGEMAYLNDIAYPPFSFSGDVPEFVSSVLTYYNDRCASDRMIYTGSITVTDPNNYIARSSEDYSSCWSILSSKLVDTLGGYFAIRYGSDGKRYLDYLSSPGIHNTQKIEFGYNLLDIEHYIDTESLYTVLIPLGAEYEENGEQKRLRIDKASNNDSGLDYIATSFVNTYGRIDEVVIWDDVEVANNLYTKAVAYANTMAARSVSITARVVDMHIAESGVARMRVGDLFDCVSTPHNLSVTLMLTKREWNLNDPVQDSVSLGSERETFSESLSSNIRDLTNEADKQKRYNANLSERIDNAKGLYTTEETDDEGRKVTWMHDKPLRGESTLIINVSDQGIHASPNRGATWYGFDFSGEVIAEMIDTYSISANRIYGGMLSSKATDRNGNPVTYIDMDSGEVAKLGNIAWVKRSSGNESLKWMGAD